MMLKRTFKHFHFCCGLGGGGKGFNNAKPIVGNMQAEWQCTVGIDIDASGLRAHLLRVASADRPSSHASIKAAAVNEVCPTRCLPAGRAQDKSCQRTHRLS